MRYRILLLLPLIVLCLVALTTHTCQAQTYSQIQSDYPNALEMQVRTEEASVYDGPNAFSELKPEFKSVRIFLAFERVGSWYKIAVPESGFVGYIKQSEVTLVDDTPRMRAILALLNGEEGAIDSRATDGDGSPCTDPLYVDLKGKSLEKMTDREYEYFRTKDAECTEFQRIVLSEGENALANTI